MNKKMNSGIGRYHTNNPDNPKARPFLSIAYPEIGVMAAEPPTTAKQAAQWFIPSILPSRSKSAQMKQGEFYCLVLDIDDKPPTLNKLADAENQGNGAIAK